MHKTIISMNLRLKKLFPVAIAMLVTASAVAQQSVQMSLKDAVSYAMDNNLGIKNSQIRVLDADQQIIERKAFGIPQLKGEVSFQRYLQVPRQPLPSNFNIFGIFGQALAVDLRDYLSEDTRNAVDQFFQDADGGDAGEGVAFFLKNNFTASLNLDAMIFDGSYFVGLKAARAYRKLVRQELDAKKQEVKNSVVQVYLPVLLIQENVDLLDKNIANLEKLLFETKELYKAGFAEQLDIDRQELSLANLQVERESLARQKEIALRALKFTIGFPVNEPLEITDNLDTLVGEASEDELTAQPDYRGRPEFAVIEQSIGLNELNVRLNRAGYLPSLRAFGAYQQLYQGNDFKTGFWAPASFVGLRLNVPIFDGFEKKARIQRATLDLELARNQKTELERAIQLEVRNARDNYFSARRKLESQQKNLQLAERIYNTAQVKYREGVGSSLEITQAEQSLYSTQSNYMQAIYDLLIAKSDLDAALGK